MTVEKIIKDETDKFIDDFRKRAEGKGGDLSSTDELLLRAGVHYGIIIAGRALIGAELNLTEGE